MLMNDACVWRLLNKQAAVFHFWFKIHNKKTTNTFRSHPFAYFVAFPTHCYSLATPNNTNYLFFVVIHAQTTQCTVGRVARNEKRWQLSISTRKCDLNAKSTKEWPTNRPHALTELFASTSQMWEWRLIHSIAIFCIWHRLRLSRLNSTKNGNRLSAVFNSIHFDCDSARPPNEKWIYSELCADLCWIWMNVCLNTLSSWGGGDIELIFFVVVSIDEQCNACCCVQCEQQWKEYPLRNKNRTGKMIHGECCWSAADVCHQRALVLMLSIGGIARALHSERCRQRRWGWGRPWNT